jgi:hypothetical protein
VVQQYVGGLRAGMGYCGAKNISALQRRNSSKSLMPECRKVTPMILKSPVNHLITAANNLLFFQNKY